MAFVCFVVLVVVVVVQSMPYNLLVVPKIKFNWN